MSQLRKRPHPGWSLAIDYGPLLVFFLAYRMTGVTGGGPVEQISAVVRSTGAFMVAIVIALIVSKWRLGRISPMLWLSAILVIGFGGLTIWFHDPKFIQIKPTIIYVLLSGVLFAGLARGKPMLKYVLEAGYDGLTDRGWMILSRNWAVFFAGMAVLNEVLRASLSFDSWIVVKVWVVSVLSFVFAMANIPVMTKYGMGDEG